MGKQGTEGRDVPGATTGGRRRLGASFRYLRRRIPEPGQEIFACGQRVTGAGCRSFPPHGHGDGTIGSGAIAQLPTLVQAPAVFVSGRSEGTGHAPSREESGEPEFPGQRHRDRRRLRRSITELSVEVLAPAEGGAVSQECAGMHGPGGESIRRCREVRGGRRKDLRFGPHATPQLAEAVVSPAQYLVLIVDAAGVPGPSSQITKIPRNRRR